MGLRVLGIILLIAGVLVFVWATIQSSSQGSDSDMPFQMLVPKQLQSKYSAPSGSSNAYLPVQIVSALVAVAGGVMIFVKKRSS